MCQKATEIQRYKREESHWTNHDFYYEPPNDQEMKWVWLPRQDQLQDMIDLKLTELFRVFVDEMTYEAGGRYFYGNLYEKSMEKIWLIFIMAHKHQKYWNGKEWILLCENCKNMFYAIGLRASNPYKCKVCRKSGTDRIG